MLVHSLGFMVYSHNHNFVLHKCMFSLGFMVYNNHTCPWLRVGYLLLIAMSLKWTRVAGSKGVLQTVESQKGASR